MKRISLCITLILFATLAFSQTIPTQTITKQDYLQKSKRQRNTGWILAGGGLALELSGAIAYKHGNAGLLLFGGGLLSQVASIPFFISSGINKRKSKKASLTFEYQQTPVQLPALADHCFYPAISLNVKL